MKMKRRYFLILIFFIFMVVAVQSLSFRPAPTHRIVKQVNCISCHAQELIDLENNIHIKQMGLNQNRTINEYMYIYGNMTNSSDPEYAYKEMVAPCYTCHATYSRYDRFGLTDPFVYSGGNITYTIANLTVSDTIYNAQYGTIIDWPYPDSNITVINSNSTNNITVELTLLSIDPPNSSLDSDLKIIFSNYSGQQTNSIYDFAQTLSQNATQVANVNNVAGDYFNISLLLQGSWNNSLLVMVVSGTDTGIQSFNIIAGSSPSMFNIPKDITGSSYFKTNGSINAIRLDAIWNLWTNYPVNGIITSSDTINTEVKGNWTNASSCSAPDGMCHIIQQSTFMGFSDGINPDKTFYPHKMEFVTSKQCKVCHFNATIPNIPISFTN